MTARSSANLDSGARKATVPNDGATAGLNRREFAVRIADFQNEGLRRGAHVLHGVCGGKWLRLSEFDCMQALSERSAALTISR